MKEVKLVTSGAGAAASANTSTYSSSGGAGTSNNISGSSVTYATGGYGTTSRYQNPYTTNAVTNSGNGGSGVGENSSPPNNQNPAEPGSAGVVILRYPSSNTITIGAGLTGSTSTVGANKVTTITAGTGNVSWA